MSDVTTITLYMGTTAGINAVSAISKKNSPLPALIATGFLYGVLVILASVWRGDVARAFAGLILTVNVIAHGFPLITAGTKLINGLQVNSVAKGGTTGQGSSGAGGGGGGGGGR